MFRGYPTNADPYKDKTSTLPPPRKPQTQSRRPWQPNQNQFNHQQPVRPLQNPHPTTNSSARIDPKPQNQTAVVNGGSRPAITSFNNNIFNNPASSARGAKSNSNSFNQAQPKNNDNVNILFLGSCKKMMENLIKYNFHHNCLF